MARKEIDNLKIKEKRKNDILQGSLITFCKLNFNDINIDKIAKNTACSRTLIYYYFKSKTDILNALIFDYELKLSDFKAKLDDFSKENTLFNITNFLVEKINSNKNFFYFMQFVYVLFSLEKNLDLKIDKIKLLFNEIILVFNKYLSEKNTEIYLSLINGLSLTRLNSNINFDVNDILSAFNF